LKTGIKDSSMTQTAEIALALLKGETVSIMNAFNRFHCTNAPREISRGIEKPFGLIVSRDRVDFISKYGRSGYYYRYRLNKTKANAAGIAKMIEYCKRQLGTMTQCKTEKERKIFIQTSLFLDTL
jgi:hypothetical protein